MDYTVDIIDTQDETLVTSVERAVASSIVLDWKGGDKKDDLFIVGSSLSFTMVGMSMADGQYLDLFTGDETRYRVRLYDTSNTTIWSGFLLPDSYSEPYSNAPILVDFEATDGLGRLKGKYLPEDFYREEKSVIEILAACLRLTGLDLSFRFAPAIENSQQKDYNQIYLETSYFKKGDDKEDAYQVLDRLLKSMLCTLYQSDNYYNIEGLNIRNRRVYNAKIYSPSGVLTDEVEVTRLSKYVTGIEKPYIAMQPPYGRVRVEHKREGVGLPDTLSSEKNDGWVVVSQQETLMYGLDWRGNNNFYALAATPDYNVFVDKSTTPSSDFISLRSRPYVKKARKYRLDLDFRLVQENINDGLRDNLIAQGKWDNPFNFRVILTTKDFDGNDKTEVLFANYGVSESGHKYRDINFTADDKTIENTMEFVAQNEGVLDIEVYAFLDESNGIKRIEIAEAEIEQIGFSDVMVSEKVLNEEYTLEKDLEIEYADDFTGFSKGFRLQKLRDRTDSYNAVTVFNLGQTIQRNGKYYVHVKLKEANLVKENINQVYHGPDKLKVEDVIYNVNDSEEHALVFDSNPNLQTNPTVRVYDFNAVTEKRGYWEEWTDSIYQVERIRYIDAVSNILNRMFDKPVKAIPDLTVKNNVKFNDFIDFNFQGDTQWMISNCRWDIDAGFSDISVIENYYAVSVGENIPPVVEAGNDITIGNRIEEAQLTCEAYDPDGYIVSYLWEEVSGKGAVIDNPNSQNTSLSGLIYDYYTFKITVTDNNGATASDTVNVVREQEHELLLTQIQQEQDKDTYTLSFEPRMGSEYSVNIMGSYKVSSTQGHPYNTAYAAFRVIIDGVTVREHQIGTIYDDGNNTAPIQQGDDFNITYIGDQAFILEVEAYAEVHPDGTEQAYAKTEFTIDNCEFVDGFGKITNLPQTRDKEMISYP